MGNEKPLQEGQADQKSSISKWRAKSILIEPTESISAAKAWN